MPQGGETHSKNSLSPGPETLLLPTQLIPVPEIEDPLSSQVTQHFVHEVTEGSVVGVGLGAQGKHGESVDIGSNIDDIDIYGETG